MRIICPACGLSSLISSETGDVWVRCSGCGKRFAAETDSSALPDQVETEDDLATAAATASLHRGKPIRSKSSNRSVVAGLIGAISMLVIAGLAVVAWKVIAPPAVLPQPLVTVAPTTAPVAWDRSHRAELLAMKSQADSAALAGDWRTAYDGYRQILAAVADQDITDPMVLQVVAGARVQQDRVLAQLMSSPVGSQSPATQPAASRVEQPPMMVATTNAATIPTTVTAAVKPETTQPQIAGGLKPSPLNPAQIAADTAAPLPGQPPPAPKLHAFTLPDAVTDEQIGDSITNGVAFLKGQFRNGEVTTQAPNRNGNNGPQRGRPGGPAGGQAGGQGGGRAGGGPPPSNLDNGSNLPAPPPGQAPLVPGPAFTAPWESAFSQPGVDALCVYALLHAGQAMDGKVLSQTDPFAEEIIRVLKQYNLIFTYHRSLRAAALAVFNRSQDNAALEEDVRWLLAAGPRGAYTYTLPANTDQMGWDNSNSQYGLLGVWSGAMAGQAVPSTYWFNVQGHWNACANPDGTFGYTLGTSSTTMTCAGVASLLVASDYLDVNKANPAQNQFINNGLNWLDAGDNCMSNWNNIGGSGYALYGLERVGLASGFKYFGKHDWYGELAKRLVSEQHMDGSWGSNPPVNGNVTPQTLVDTSYALLFLARGRHPIVLNKLRYDGNWNNRPHDASHLARFAAHELERPLNWQVVNLRRNWFDWMDCPVLYISGDKKPSMSARDYAALRDFANGGGMIFTHADGGSAEFNRWVVTDLVRTVFPKYELLQVPRDHPLYSTVYRLKDPPPLLSISNASRIMLIHSPTDLSNGWQLDWTDEKKPAFQLGVNLFVYAAGKGNLKNRLASNYIPEDPAPADSTRQIARLQYASEWDPEPYAWTRFSRYFQWETHQGIDPITVQLKDLKPGTVPMAVLTGTVRHDFTDAERQAARSYVEAGGVLIIDACGGQNAFLRSVQETLLPQAFDGVSPLPINPTHPLLIPSRPFANDLTHPMLRGYASEHGGKDMPILTLAYGKGWVIFSRLDVTTGLLGTDQWGILGFDPAYAQALMKNAVLWAEARTPASPATAPATVR